MGFCWYCWKMLTIYLSWKLYLSNVIHDFCDGWSTISLWSMLWYNDVNLDSDYHNHQDICWISCRVIYCYSESDGRPSLLLNISFVERISCCSLVQSDVLSNNSHDYDMVQVNKAFGFHAWIFHKIATNIQNVFIRRKVFSITMFIHAQSAIF